MNIDKKKCWRCRDNDPQPLHDCPLGDTCACCEVCTAVCQKASRAGFVDEARTPILDVIKNAMKSPEREPIVIPATTAGEIPILREPIPFKRLTFFTPEETVEWLERQTFEAEPIQGWSFGVAYHRDENGRIVLDHAPLEPVWPMVPPKES